MLVRETDPRASPHAKPQAKPHARLKLTFDLPLAEVLR
jgi:hypothetical protein